MPILVLQVGGSIFGHGGLAIARSAGRLGIRVYGIPPNLRAAGTRSRYWTGLFEPPADPSSDEAWLETLTRIGRDLGEAVLVTTDDAATVMVADHADALREHFRFPDQPPELMRQLADKGAMTRLCHELDIPVPNAEFPASRADVERVAEEWPFPIVAKRIAGWRPARVSSPPSVCVARTREELLGAYDRMEAPDGPNVLLQEYIPGGSEAVWMFNGYFDSSSECVVGFTGTKLRQRGPGAGVTTLGLCVANPEVDASTRRLMKAVGYQGILDIGYRYDRRDGRYKLLDVNPRIGETFRLFVGGNGIDVLRALYLDLTGQPVPPTDPPVRRKWIAEPFDTVCSLQMWRQGDLRPREWVRSLRGIDETAWLARDDPRPTATLVAAAARELIRRRLRRVGA